MNELANGLWWGNEDGGEIYRRRGWGKKRVTWTRKTVDFALQKNFINLNMQRIFLKKKNILKII